MKISKQAASLLLLHQQFIDDMLRFVLHMGNGNKCSHFCEVVFASCTVGWNDICDVRTMSRDVCHNASLYLQIVLLVCPKKRKDVPNSINLIRINDLFSTCQASKTTPYLYQRALVDK
jgi:hypothetical protein